MGPPLVAPGATRSDGTVKLTCREYVDKTFNDPTFSPLASLISNVVLVAILVSTVSFVVGTEPALEGSPFLDQLEIVVVMIFSVEYVTRFLVTFENRCSFVLTPLNMIDLLAILPWYVEKVAGAGGGEALRVLRVLRVVRIFRVFKVGDMKSKLEVFTLCMVNSIEALKLLVFFFGIAVLIFSSLMYYAEHGVRTEVDGETVFMRSDGSESPYTSIAATFWWAIVTMTTVGYGDTFPVDPPGKAVATLAMLGGVLVLALPLSVIGSNFTDAYADTLKAKAHAELSSQVPGGADVDVFVLASKELESHCADIEKICGALSHGLTIKGSNAGASALKKQFELQLSNVKQACDGLAQTVTDQGFLQVMLGDAGSSANVAKARAKLEQIKKSKP